MLIIRIALSVFLGVMASAELRADATAPDVAVLRDRLLAAVTARQPFPEIALEFPALDDVALYAVQDSFVRHLVGEGARIGGFKGGFIPVAPSGGVLFSTGFLESPARLRAADFVSLLIEAEIGFEFCAAVTAPLPDVAALQAKVCRLRPAVELPDAAFKDMAALVKDLPRLRRALIAPNMATRLVLLGAPVPTTEVDVNTVPVSASREGVLLGARQPGAPVPDLWESVRWIINEHALARGYAVPAGYIVIPGNLTGLHAGEPGRYEVDYGPLGKVQLTVE